MAAALAPLVSIAGIALYFLVTTRFAIYRHDPWEYLAVVAAGAAIGGVSFCRRPRATAAAATLVSVALFGLSSWYVFSFSVYGTREDRPRVGEAFPDFTLPASDGAPFHLADAAGRRLLIVFYRGDW